MEVSNSIETSMTRVIIKISTHPWYPSSFDWFSWGWSKCFFFFQQFQNGRLKKPEFFKIPNSQNKFVNISWIGFWVSRIDWCKGHWYGWETVRHMLKKQAKNAFFVFLGCFCAWVGQPHDHIGCATSMPFASINPTNPIDTGQYF